MVDIFWLLLQITAGYNLILPLLLFLLWKIFRNTDKEFANQRDIHEIDYAIVVTAYQETHTLAAVVDSILNSNYSKYLVYIVADNCDISELKFNDPRVFVLKPPSTLASNTRSHQYAINNFRREHEYITIIDSDNLLHPEYLNQLNKVINNGFIAVQGQRKAKNLDTVLSRLDAIRDIYYHFYDGRILFDLGSSATLSGSGMAFRTDLYKEFLAEYNVSGAGFDKVLQYFLLRKDLRIAVSEDAIVYDEKTSKADQLIKQRSRWINTWFKYFKYGFSLVGLGIKNFSINQLLFGITLLRPPLFIFIILSGLFMIINIWVSITYFFMFFVAFTLFILSFLIALYNSKADKIFYHSLLNIPRFMVLQLVSLVQSRNANQRSVATKHYHSEIIDKPNGKEKR